MSTPACVTDVCNLSSVLFSPVTLNINTLYVRKLPVNDVMWVRAKNVLYGHHSAKLFLTFQQIDASKVNSFKDFPLSQKTLKGLKESGYMKPTEIQKESIGYSLQGLDILGAAKTGSGKTLAFIIPVSWTML